MTECWNDCKESRPTFLELKEEFDALISHEERCNYLSLDNVRLEKDTLAAVGGLGRAERAEEVLDPAKEGIQEVLCPAEDCLVRAGEDLDSVVEEVHVKIDDDLGQAEEDNTSTSVQNRQQHMEDACILHNTSSV